MRAITLLGIVVLVVGVLALVYQGFTYTTSEQVVDLGPIEVTEQDTRTVPLPPVIGAAAVLGGIGLILAGSRKK